jgi:hypothetical protein
VRVSCVLTMGSSINNLIFSPETGTIDSLDESDIEALPLPPPSLPTRLQPTRGGKPSSQQADPSRSPSPTPPAKQPPTRSTRRKGAVKTSRSPSPIRTSASKNKSKRTPLPRSRSAGIDAKANSREQSWDHVKSTKGTTSRGYSRQQHESAAESADELDLIGSPSTTGNRSHSVTHSERMHTIDSPAQEENEGTLTSDDEGPPRKKSRITLESDFPEVEGNDKPEVESVGGHLDDISQEQETDGRASKADTPSQSAQEPSVPLTVQEEASSDDDMELSEVDGVSQRGAPEIPLPKDDTKEEDIEVDNPVSGRVLPLDGQSDAIVKDSASSAAVKIEQGNVVDLAEATMLDGMSAASHELTSKIEPTEVQHLT